MPPVSGVRITTLILRTCNLTTIMCGRWRAVTKHLNSALCLNNNNNGLPEKVPSPVPPNIHHWTYWDNRKREEKIGISYSAQLVFITEVYEHAATSILSTCLPICTNMFRDPARSLVAWSCSSQTRRRNRHFTGVVVNLSLTGAIIQHLLMKRPCFHFPSPEHNSPCPFSY